MHRKHWKYSYLAEKRRDRLCSDHEAEIKKFKPLGNQLNNTYSLYISRNCALYGSQHCAACRLHPRSVELLGGTGRLPFQTGKKCGPSVFRQQPNGKCTPDGSIAHGCRLGPNRTRENRLKLKKMKANKKCDEEKRILKLFCFFFLQFLNKMMDGKNSTVLRVGFVRYPPAVFNSCMHFPELGIRRKCPFPGYCVEVIILSLKT